jgi:hypothetical protein
MVLDSRLTDLVNRSLVNAGEARFSHDNPLVFQLEVSAARWVVRSLSGKNTWQILARYSRGSVAYIVMIRGPVPICNVIGDPSACKLSKSPILAKILNVRQIVSREQ